MTATTKLVVIVGVLTAGMIGWVAAGYPGAAAGLVLGVVLTVFAALVVFSTVMLRRVVVAQSGRPKKAGR